MKKDDGFLLAISQDPLLTILAVVLLSTVWLVIPARRVEQNAGLSPEKLRTLEKEKKQIEAGLQALDAERESLRRQATTRRDAALLLVGRLSAAKAEVEALQRELSAFERELASLPSESQVQSRDTNLAELKKQRDQRQRDIQDLQKQIEAAQQKSAQARRELDARKNGVARLQNEVKVKQEELGKLNPETTTREQEGGFRGRVSFASTKGKTQYVQLIHDRAYPLDDEHYHISERGVVDVGGRKVSAVRIGRKVLAKGDDISGLASAESAFMKLLRRLDKEEYRIMFLVHGDSYSLFRAVREVASRNDFESGWWPEDRESFIVRTDSSAAGFQVPSTDPARR